MTQISKQCFSSCRQHLTVITTGIILHHRFCVRECLESTIMLYTAVDIVEGSVTVRHTVPVMLSCQQHILMMQAIP